MPKAERISLMPLEGDTIQQSAGGGNNARTGIQSMGGQLGCKHYSRGCKLVCPLCCQAFWCRFCHDEVMAESGLLLRKEAHKLPRHKVSEVVCGACEKTQPVAAMCRHCGHQFGNYTCLECRLFDNDDSKQQFHCDSCGICRVGGKENFWHCDKCGCCLCNNLRGQHRCVERTLHQECAVCMDYLFDSTKASSVLQCGHTIHAACLEQLITIGGRRRCPICSAPFSL